MQKTFKWITAPSLDLVHAKTCKCCKKKSVLKRENKRIRKIFKLFLMKNQDIF